MYRFEVSCPQCGGDLAHQAAGRPDIVSTRAIARCASCGPMLLEVTVRREAVATGHELRRKAMRDRIPA